MRKLFFIVILICVTYLKLFSQVCSNFKNYEDSMAIVEGFHYEIIYHTKYEKEFSTVFKNNGRTDTILVFENLKPSSTEVGAGDPLCLWVNKSILEKKDTCKWIQTKELYLKGNWIFLTIDVVQKNNKIITKYCTMQYKVKCKYISTVGYFKKIKIKKYFP